MHAHRLFSASRAITSVTILTLALGFAGCNRSAPPPDDNALNSALHNRISSDDALKAEQIQTSVQNGVATLNGTVSSEAARSLAASDAAQVAGLKTVVNNLTVQAPTLAPAPVAETTPPPSEPARAARKKAPAPKPRVEPVKHTPAPIERVPPPVQQAQAAPPPPPAVPAAPAFRDITIPSGTTIPVRITQTLSSATAQQGDSFSGTVATDIIVDGLVVIPQGTGVSGRVEAVQEAAHFKGNSLLTVGLTRVNHRGGAVAVVTEPYSVAGKGRGKNTAEKVGGGAAIGAILGGIFGGGKGAAIGAAAGGGLGAGANAVTKGEQVQIPSESLVRFRLSSPVALRVSTSNTRNTPVSPNLQQRDSSEQ
ncbi:MAG TPA: BON domain-containing protein [Edaphobacter sp.]|nr:BON domain-containing protein [Edaphobacter sp.]